MSFDYSVPVPSYQNTPNYGSKTVLAKSSLIDIAAGSGGAHNTDYDLGIVLPKGAQVIAIQNLVETAVSGGSISAATISWKARVGGLFSTISGGINVFATSGTISHNAAGYMTNFNTWENNDYRLQYTLSLTGTGPATAGKIYVTVLYVV